jgi:hypothetical protein
MDKMKNTEKRKKTSLIRLSLRAINYAKVKIFVFFEMAGEGTRILESREFGEEKVRRPFWYLYD